MKLPCERIISELPYQGWGCIFVARVRRALTDQYEKYLIGIDRRVLGLLQRRPYLIFNIQPPNQRLGFGIHAQRDNQPRQRPSQLCFGEHRFALKFQYIVGF